MLDGVIIKERLQFKLKFAKDKFFYEDMETFSGYVSS